jgi:hypothetical protein
LHKCTSALSRLRSSGSTSAANSRMLASASAGGIPAYRNTGTKVSAPVIWTMPATFSHTCSGVPQAWSAT